MSRTHLMHVEEISRLRAAEIRLSADAARMPARWWSPAEWLRRREAVSVHAYAAKLLNDVLTGHNGSATQEGKSDEIRNEHR